METLKGVFPHIAPPPKRDFLRENVAKIKTIQPRRVRKPSNQTEYSKYNQHNSSNLKPKKKLHHGSSASLSTCSTRAPPLNNLRKSMSQLSMQSRDFGVQTTDPNDEYFLKDSIIRYPSASTVRSTGSSHQHQLTCTRGHQLDMTTQHRPQTPVDRQRRQHHSEKMDRHLSNLSEFLDQGAITKKSKSILKKSNKNLINESQQKLDRDDGGGDTKEDIIEFVDLSRDEEDEDAAEKRKEEKRKEALIKLAEADPDCPQGHVPLLENERVEALKLAKNRKNCEIEFQGSASAHIHIFFLLIFRLQGARRRAESTADDLRDASCTQSKDWNWEGA